MINPYFYPGMVSYIPEIQKSKSLKIQVIELIVCHAFDTTPAELSATQKIRKREYVKARQTVQYLAYKYTTKSLNIIALYYNKDHATIINSRKVIKNIIETKDKLFFPKVITAEMKVRDHINELKNGQKNNHPETTNTSNTICRSKAVMVRRLPYYRPNITVKLPGLPAPGRAIRAAAFAIHQTHEPKLPQASRQTCRKIRGY